MTSLDNAESGMKSLRSCDFRVVIVLRRVVEIVGFFGWHDDCIIGLQVAALI